MSPRQRTPYTNRIIIMIDDDSKWILLAISYHTGQDGEISNAARHLIKIGMNEYMKGLSSDGLEKFNTILENVRIQKAMERKVALDAARK